MMNGRPVGRAGPGGGHFIPGVVAILVCTAVYSCWCGAPLIWDGSYQFAVTLISGKPFVYGTRFHTWLLWRPLSWLARHTTDLTPLVMAYGLPFLLAPAAGVLLSWWFVRRHAPWLIIWAVFGVAIATLPGQIFVINDSIFQQHLFWPVFLGAMVSLSRPRQVVWLAVALMQLSHPIGMVLLSGAAGCAAAIGLLHADRDQRRELLVRAGLLALLAAAAALKLLLLKDIEATREATWAMAIIRWRQGVVGPPLDGLQWMWAAAALVMARGLVWGRGVGSSRAADWAGRLLTAAAFACVAAGALRWAPWASDGYCSAVPGHQNGWARAIDYRRWIVPLTMPFFFLAFAEAGVRAVRLRQARGRSQKGKSGALPGGARLVSPPTSEPLTALRAAPPLGMADWRVRVPMCYLLASVFAVVLSLQSRVYLSQTRRLMHDVKDNGRLVVPRQSVPWISGSTLAHWGTGPLVAVMQGPRPTRLFTDEGMGDVPALLDGDPPRVPLALTDDRSPDPGPGGWFDYRPFIKTWQEMRTRP